MSVLRVITRSTQLLPIVSALFPIEVFVVAISHSELFLIEARQMSNRSFCSFNFFSTSEPPFNIYCASLY